MRLFLTTASALLCALLLTNSGASAGSYNWVNIYKMYVSISHLPGEGCEYMGGTQLQRVTIRCGQERGFRGESHVGLYRDANWSKQCTLVVRSSITTGNGCFYARANSNTYDIFPDGYKF